MRFARFSLISMLCCLTLIGAFRFLGNHRLLDGITIPRRTLCNSQCFQKFVPNSSTIQQIEARLWAFTQLGYSVRNYGTTGTRINGSVQALYVIVPPLYPLLSPLRVRLIYNSRYLVTEISIRLIPPR